MIAPTSKAPKVRKSDMMKRVVPSRIAWQSGTYRMAPGAFLDKLPEWQVLQKRWNDFEKMRRDPIIADALDLKCDSVLGEGWAVHPAGGDHATPEQVEQAEFVEWALRQVPGTVEDVLRSVMDAVAIGFSVIEKVYTVSPSSSRFPGRIVPTAFYHLDPSAVGWQFDEDGSLTAVLVTVPGRMVQEAVPLEKVIHWAYRSRYESPVGAGDFVTVYRPWWIKNETLKFWAVAIERTGVPRPIGKYEDGAAPSFQTDLLDKLRASAAANAMVIPKSVEIEMQEPKSDGAIFKSIISYCDSEIVKGIIGASLVTDEGERTGSLALGKVHAAAAAAKVARLKRDLEEHVMGEQVIRQLIDLNYPPEQVDGYPQFSLPDPTTDIVQRTTSVVNLIDRGVISPDEPWIREALGFPRVSTEKEGSTPNSRVEDEDFVTARIAE